MNNYGELKTTVADWLNRADLTDAQLALFVRLAEDDIYRDYRGPDNEFVATYNKDGWDIDGGATQALTDGVAHELPENYREMRHVTYDDKTVLPISLAYLRRIRNYGALGAVSYYAIAGRQTQFADSLDTDPANWEGELKYYYYGAESLDSMPVYQVPTNPVDAAATEATATPITQSDTNTTRLFQRHPMMYLHGALYHASLFFQDDAGAQKWGALFTAAVQSLENEGKRGRYPGGTKQVQSAY